MMIIVQKAAIKKEDKYLIVLRAPDAHVFPNCWDLPGGKLEPGEEKIHGVKREVMEETTLKVDISEIEGVYDLKFSDGKEVQITIYSTTSFEGEVKLSHEHTEFKWATKKEILELKTEPYLPHYINGEEKAFINIEKPHK